MLDGLIGEIKCFAESLEFFITESIPQAEGNLKIKNSAFQE